jgi:uncharacterized protein (DUF885 family)
MHSSRREFLLGSAAMLALSAASRRVSADPAASERLQKLFDEAFERVLEVSPQLTVTLGRDTGARSEARMQLDDETPAGQAQRKSITTGILADVRAFDASGLSLQGRLNYESVLFALKAESSARECFTFGRIDRRISPYVVSHFAGSYLDAPEFISRNEPSSATDATDVYVSRLRAFAHNLDGESERISSDAAAGVVPPDFILERTLTRMRAQLGKLTGKEHTEQVASSLAQQIALLESLRPKATHNGGLSGLKNGEACYTAALRVGTATEPNIREFQRRGLAEVHALNARADTLFKKIGLRRGSVEERLRAISTHERNLYPDTDAGKDRAVADMNALVQSILPPLKRLFKSPIKKNIEVRKLTPAEELAGRVGYRVAPSLDGTRAGVYFVDLHAIRERPTWSLPSVTYHETAPGHLLQLPFQEAAKLHPLRQQLNPRGYFEGWAVYAEALAQEIGVYYDDPQSEIGFLQSRLFRVARMLVDIGIHANGWSREAAINSLMGMTAQPRALCETDVDRYFVMPGMIGGDEIGYYGWRDARERARRKAGGKFDLASFHNRGLEFGPLPQSLLELAVSSNADA